MKTLRRLPILLLPAILLAVSAMPAAAVGAPDETMARKDVQVLSDDGAGTLNVSIFARDPARLTVFSAAAFQVVPIYAADGPDREGILDHKPMVPRSREDGIARFGPVPQAGDAVHLVFDASDLNPPDGVEGYRVIVRGAAPANVGRKDGSLGIDYKKPPTWVVVDHWFGSADRIGIKARIRCHTASMWTQWATWTLLFYGQIHCPPHGAELLEPGSTTLIEVQFDGAYLTEYETWINSSHTIWTFYPGPLDP